MYKCLSFAALLLTAEEVSARHHHHHHQHHPQSLHQKGYRPLPGTAPWHKAVPRAPAIEFPHDYPVPNFGVDNDVKNTQKHIADQEKKLKHQYNAKKYDGSLEHYDNRNYYSKGGYKDDLVGVAVEIGSDPICSSAGCTQYKHPPPPPGIPMDYPVPDYGADPDIAGTMDSLNTAQELVGHKWSFGTPESKIKWHNKAKDTMYDFAPDLDLDVKFTDHSLKAAEDALGHVYGSGLIQIGSDPIYSSIGLQQYKHPAPPAGPPMDYPVPDFGPDPDMVGTMASLDFSEKALKHNWEFGTEASKAKWHNKAKDTLYDFAPELDSDIVTTNQNRQNAVDALGFVEDVQLSAESDPICSSAGCTQYKHPAAPASPPVDYFVPNFGADPEIAGTLTSVEQAEKQLNHSWKFGTEETAAQWHNKAKDTLYNFAPELDNDIKISQKNEAAAQDAVMG